MADDELTDDENREVSELLQSPYGAARDCVRLRRDLRHLQRELQDVSIVLMESGVAADVAVDYGRAVLELARDRNEANARLYVLWTFLEWVRSRDWTFDKLHERADELHDRGPVEIGINVLAERDAAIARADDAERGRNAAEVERLTRERDAAIARADDAEQALDSLHADIDEHLPDYVLDDGTAELANYRERIEYVGDELRQDRKERAKLMAEVERLKTEDERSTEYLRELLRKVDDEQKGIAVCSWCALPTNSDEESKRTHQMTCSKSPLIADLNRELERVRGLVHLLQCSTDVQRKPCDHSGIGKPGCATCDPRIREAINIDAALAPAGMQK